VKIRFLSGGFCKQHEYFVGTGRWKWRKFHAVFLHGIHPVHGEFLIDAGYGPAFVQATRRFPAFLMRWITYVPGGQDFTRTDYLERQGITRENIRHIFISHFHPDHIGGLTFFPDAKLVYRRESLARLVTFSPMKQLHNAFLKDLVPADIRSRSICIEESDFRQSDEYLFHCYDFWGDNSLILLDLPGHALGHTGYLINTETSKLLYVTDAYWEYQSFKESRQLPWIVRKVLYSEKEYLQTLENISILSERLQTPPVACHCSTTEQRISDLSGMDCCIDSSS